MPLRALAQLAPVVIPWHVTAGEAQDTQIFVADRDYEVMEVRETHRVVGAAASTAMVRKCTAGQAPASGTALLTAEIALDSTADTPVRPALVAARATRQLARGAQLAIDFTGTVTAYEGMIQITLQPKLRNTRY